MLWSWFPLVQLSSTVRPLVYCVVSLALSASSALAQPGPEDDTFRVVNWNVEWFGNDIQHDAADQTAAVRTVLAGLDADVYALCEIVSVDSLAAVINRLPDSFGYVVSQYGSLADGPSDPDYASAQKLALVYRKSRVKKLGSRALLQGSGDAYYNFASGRYPFLVSTEVLGRDNRWRRVEFIVLHAKAMSDFSSCQRRRWGAAQLKDTLDRHFASAAVVLLGDYNDDLDESICGGSTTSAYASFLSDSTDGNHYQALTLPLSRTGVSSIDGYSALIDHAIVSNELAQAYIPWSAAVLRSAAEALVPDFNDRASDHFPVQTSFVLDGSTVGIRGAVKSFVERGVQVWPNPAGFRIFLKWERQVPGPATYTLVNPIGVPVLSGLLSDPSAGIDVQALPAGLYHLRISGENMAPHTATVSVVH